MAPPPLPTYRHVTIRLRFFPSDETVVCVVCGGVCRPTAQSAASYPLRDHDWLHPWLVKADKGFWEWCKDPRNATSRRQGPDDAPVGLFQVERFRGGGSGFDLSGGGTASINTSHAEMYLPIHKACYHLTMRFCDYQSRFEIDFRKFSNRSDQCGIPSRLGHFYEIWMKRALMTIPGHQGILNCPIDEPHGYLGILLADNLRMYMNARRRNPAISVQEADPSSRKKRTSLAVIRHLVRLRPAEKGPKDGYQTLKLRLEGRLGLARELKQMIYEQLGPLKNLSRDQLACTRVLPPSWWKESLFGGDLFPWLFDLDKNILAALEKAVTEKAKRTGMKPLSVDDDFDWELLCRRLGQRGVVQEGGILHGEEHLENRYRIWTLLDSARLGHTVSRYSRGIRP
ncbi:uncharacterized protein F4812DRAFT_468197 [Daldinia caldariorum]|uniref:uncharacterized protein n=1 Tax=Daldinia caldariorum TaxID=326644 RepID=UPI002008A690|nr:uncharacterized protein F4812DRAFT_468197 [Daldinia caldariorum]KAI1464028.1 hypothetical protein F4812DRAFT_468197 [Daldinia caldariorum]